MEIEIANASGDSQNRYRVLVVDDERQSADILAKTLTKKGYSASVRYDAQSALESIKTDGIDIVLTDLRMPGMNGLELVRRGKKLDRSIEFVMITGYGSMEEEIMALRAGAVDFLHKPVDTEHLLHSLARVSDKISLSRALLERGEQLMQSEKMATIGLLSTGIAHEINNPTTFIRTNLQLMREYIKRLTPRFEDLSDPANAESARNIILTEFPEMIEEALIGTTRIQDIVSGIKHYAYMGEDNLAQNVDIREVIKKSVAMVKAKLRRNITITENYLNLKEIRGHFSKLEQVFVNLLVNAADSINDKITRLRSQGDTSSTGLIDVSATVIDGDTVDGVKTPDYLVLTFYDNGDGIAKEKLKKIWDPFFTTKPIGVGTGLGLYICYEIIKQHGGEINVQSEKEEGTAFIIKLPVEGGAAKSEDKDSNR